MRILNLSVMMSAIFLSAAATAAPKDCTATNPDETTVQHHMCKVINANDQLVESTDDLVIASCDGKNTKSCENAQRRLVKMKEDLEKIYNENNALEEQDYTEMIEASFKGRDKQRDGGEKSCQSKNVDEEARDEFILDLDIQGAASSCVDCVVYFSDRDQQKALDDKCNTWKSVYVNGAGVRSSVSKVSEKQEGICPLECKGKSDKIDDKRARVHKDLDNSIMELERASEEMRQETVRIAAFKAAVEADPEPDDCDRTINKPRIHWGGITAAYTTANILQGAADLCMPPANQTLGGYNFSGVCLIAVGLAVGSKEVYDILDQINDEYQDEQIDFLQKCVKSLSGKAKSQDELLNAIKGDTVTIKSQLDQVKVLLVTPHGQREYVETKQKNN